MSQQYRVKRKRKYSSCGKSLTYEEKCRLSEVDLVYNTNLLRLQTEEFLKEIIPNEAVRSMIEGEIARIKSNLLSFSPPQEATVERVMTAFKSCDVIIPIPDVEYNGKKHLKISAIEVVEVRGGYKDGTFNVAYPWIDICVKMPIVVTKKDMKSHAYFIKRALFLCYVARHLKASFIDADIQFITDNSGQWMPFLLLVYTSQKLNFNVVIRPYIDPISSINMNLFSPMHRNLKIGSHASAASSPHQSHLLDGSIIEAATPVFNQCILRDQLLHKCSESFTKLIQSSLWIIESVILLKIWCRNRPFGVGNNCFTGFMMTTIVCYLIMKRKITEAMDTYRILRVVLNFIASNSIKTECISFSSEPDAMEKRNCFQKHFPLVILDATGHLNLLFSLSDSNYEWMVHDAMIYMKLLNNHSNALSFKTFEHMFLTRVSFHDVFDQYFKFDLTNNIDALLVKYDSDYFAPNTTDIEMFLFHSRFILIDKIIKHALSQRYHLICSYNAPTPQWSVGQCCIPTTYRYTYGILLNTEHAFKMFVIGPSINVPAALKFRRFWGPLTKAIKYNDGSVLEVFDLNSCGKHSSTTDAIEQIVSFILHLHCYLDPNNIVYVSNQLNHLLIPNISLSSQYSQVSLDRVLYAEIESAYHSLSKILLDSSFQNFKVKDVVSSSSHLTRTSIFPPIPAHAYANYHTLCSMFASLFDKIPKKESQANKQKSAKNTEITPYFFQEAIEVIIIISTPANLWPNDIILVQLKKMLVLAKISKYLAKKKVLSSISKTHIDIYISGYLFRAHLYLPRELRMIYQQQQLQSSSTVVHYCLKPFPELARFYHYSVLHYNFIRRISLSYDTYSTTVRLFKKWISSQMLSDYFPEQVSELLVAFVYINPEPFYTPRHHLNGFRRTLHLLSTWDWTSDFLMVVDHESVITESVISEVSKKMKHNPSVLPSMVILTPYDESGVMWTQSCPNLIVMKRIVGLAEATNTFIHQYFFSPNSYELSSLLPSTLYHQLPFIPRLMDFDLVIELVSNCVPYSYLSIHHHQQQQKLPCQKSDVVLHHGLNSTMGATDATSKHKKKRDGGMLSHPIEFNPALEYLNDLKASYNDIATIFYDHSGGCYIGVVFKPGVFVPSNLNITNSLHKEPCTENIKCIMRGKGIINIQHVVEDIRLMGQGICKDVTVNKPSSYFGLNHTNDEKHHHQEKEGAGEENQSTVSPLVVASSSFLTKIRTRKTK